MSIMVGERREDQSKEQWKIDTIRRLATPSVPLQKYGGHPPPGALLSWADCCGHCSDSERRPEQATPRHRCLR